MVEPLAEHRKADITMSLKLIRIIHTFIGEPQMPIRLFLSLFFIGVVFSSPSDSQVEEKIVFSRYQEETGNSDIFIMDVDGGNQINLTQSPEGDTEPTVSPDGRRIAYVTIEFEPAIYTMNIDGSDRTLLIQDFSLKQDPAWSPDGSQIAFSHFSCLDEDPSCPWRGWGISAINVHNGELVRLSDQQDRNSELHPSWSPDGNKIVFSSIGPSGGIFVLDVASRELTQVRFPINSLPNIVWSPDGTMFAFSVSQEGRDDSDIAIMDIDGSNLRIVVDDPLSRDLYPTWSPDNRQLAFIKRAIGEGDDEIYKINIDGTGLVNLTNNIGCDSDPVWVRVGLSTLIKNRSWGEVKETFNLE